MTGSQVLAAGRGETYTCHFGRYGAVVIDTREPGSTITVGGKTYPANAGHYYYQTEDGKIAFFGLHKSRWAYADAGTNPEPKMIDGSNCIRRANLR